MAAPSEVDLAAVVVEWLEVLGADVYQEVELLPRGIRADIVARVRAELWIIEVKTSVSLALIEQAMERRRFAHRVFIAAPTGRALAGQNVCAELGIGLLDVYVGGGSTYNPSRVKEVCPSRRWNSRPVKLASRLRPEHKTHAKAGEPSGGHWTRFNGTCEELLQIVRAAGSEGIALKEAISTKHHYSSLAGARSSLASWIRDGRMPCVRLEGGRLFVTKT
jgi:hypothetical protein